MYKVANKTKRIERTDMHTIKKDGLMLIDKYRDVYTDGTKSKWQKVDPPKDRKSMIEDYLQRIAKIDGVPVSEVKKIFIPSKDNK